MDFLYLLSILFAGFSVAYSWDSSSGEYEKRQLAPLPRIGRSYAEVKRQGLIPSPRSLISWDKNGDRVHERLPLIELYYYADRRKKSSSVDEEYSNGLSLDDLELIKTFRSNLWNFYSNQDFFHRHVRQSTLDTRDTQIRLISGQDSADEDDLLDPIDLQLRAAFIPRLGKRMSAQTLDQLSDLDEAYKRAASFTPRIGRAAFTPRIGKKAAFVPRIGRSTDKMAKQSADKH